MGRSALLYIIPKSKKGLFQPFQIHRTGVALLGPVVRQNSAHSNRTLHRVKEAVALPVAMIEGR